MLDRGSISQVSLQQQKLTDRGLGSQSFPFGWNPKTKIQFSSHLFFLLVKPPPQKKKKENGKKIKNSCLSRTSMVLCEVGTLWQKNALFSPDTNMEWTQDPELWQREDIMLGLKRRTDRTDTDGSNRSGRPRRAKPRNREATLREAAWSYGYGKA